MTPGGEYVEKRSIKSLKAAIEGGLATLEITIDHRKVVIKVDFVDDVKSYRKEYTPSRGADSDFIRKSIECVKEFVNFNDTISTLQVWISKPEDQNVDEDVKNQKEFVRRVEEVLSNRKLKVNTFHIEYSGKSDHEDFVLAFLKNLVEPTKLNFGFHGDGNTELHLDEVLKLAQWNQATKLTIQQPFYTKMAAKHFKHFEESEFFHGDFNPRCLEQLVRTPASLDELYRWCNIHTLNETKSTYEYIYSHFEPYNEHDFIFPNGIKVMIDAPAQPGFNFLRPAELGVAPVRKCSEKVTFAPRLCTFEWTDVDLNGALVEVRPEGGGLVTRVQDYVDGVPHPRGWRTTKSPYVPFVNDCSDRVNRTISKSILDGDQYRIGQIEFVIEPVNGNNGYREDKRQILRKIRDRSTGARLKTDKFIIEYSGTAADEEDLTGLLNNVHLDNLEELHFRSVRNETCKLVLDKVLTMKQWKRAKKITVCSPFYTELEPAAWSHCDKTQLVLANLSVEAFQEIVENATKRPTFVYCSIKIMETQYADELLAYIKENFKQSQFLQDYQNDVLRIIAKHKYYMIQKTNRELYPLS